MARSNGGTKRPEPEIGCASFRAAYSSLVALRFAEKLFAPSASTSTTLAELRNSPLLIPLASSEIQCGACQSLSLQRLFLEQTSILVLVANFSGKGDCLCPSKAQLGNYSIGQGGNRKGPSIICPA